jgi:hypothetical protein
MPDAITLTVEDAKAVIEHVLKEGNGSVTVTIQNGVILEIDHDAKLKRSKTTTK